MTTRLWAVVVVLVVALGAVVWSMPSSSQAQAEDNAATNNSASANYVAGVIGDITGVYARSGLSGGASGGNAYLRVASGGIRSGHLATGAVGSSKIATGAVTSSKIASGAVSSSKLANGAVTEGKCSFYGIGSLDGIITDWGNIDLVEGSNITITPDYINNNITISASAFSPGSAWGLTGNDGTDPAANFLGTTDNVPLELRANNSRALRIEPNASCPNIISGSSANNVTSSFTDVDLVGSTISGGGSAQGPNTITCDYGTIGGGEYNLAGDDTGLVGGIGYVTVGGGYGNEAYYSYCTIGGGATNTAWDWHDTVSGGADNRAEGWASTIGGGRGNWTMGDFSTIPGGTYNTADGDYSFAAGRKAMATHIGTFAWADSTDAYFNVNVDNRFGVRASGGVYLYTNPGLTAGSYLAAGSGTWTSVSDRNAKTDVRTLDGRSVLEKLCAMPVSTWQYKTEDASIRHAGPMAQDFHAAFGLGDSDKSIGVVDADGISFAAIQGLYKLVQEKDATIATQGKRLEALDERLAALEGRAK